MLIGEADRAMNLMGNRGPAFRSLAAAYLRGGDLKCSSVIGKAPGCHRFGRGTCCRDGRGSFSTKAREVVLNSLKL